VFDNKCDVRTSFLAIALTCFLAAIVHAQENTTMEISRSSYAAIAYSPATGKYASASDYRSRPAAEKAALAKCGADDAVIACWVNWGFCALALGSDKSCWGWVGNTEAELITIKPGTVRSRIAETEPQVFTPLSS
jgi:hypothetical protein